MRNVDALAGVMARSTARTPWRGRLYRWVSAEFPLAPTGPDFHECATAGSYLHGRRLNAKGVQAPLYTALDPGIAALEVIRWPAYAFEDDLQAGARQAAIMLAEQGYLLFELEVDLSKALDLKRDPGLFRLLEADWDIPTRVCRGPTDTVPSQELGRAAFQAGIEGVLRPSVYLMESWDVEALVMDLFCPNLQKEVRWRRVV